MTESEADAADAAPDAVVSKSARKRAHKSLQDLGNTLMSLSPAELDLACPDPDLRAAVAAGRELKKSARARHVRHLGNLLARSDLPPLEEALAALRGDSARATARLHRAERWRERLLEDAGEEPLTELLRRHPQADRQQLRTLVRLARAERAREAPPRRFRELLRFLRALEEARGPGE